jgi:hypothetical protein
MWMPKRIAKLQNNGLDLNEDKADAKGRER